MINYCQKYFFTFVLLFFQSALWSREYYITPDGETVYYSPTPRVFVYKEKEESKEALATFIPHAKGEKYVVAPLGIFAGSNNKIYVTDAGEGRVKIFDVFGRVQRQIGQPGKGPTDLRRPGSVAVSPLGDIFVADRETRMVLIYDYSGDVRGSLDAGEKEEARFELPADIAIGDDGTIFILDSEKSRVVRYSYKKEYESSWGIFGTDAGRLNHSQSLAIGRNGDLVIADTQNHRVEIFTPGGRLVQSFGNKGGSPGEFQFPHTVAADKSGMIAVGDNGGARIQFFTPLGQYLGQIRFASGDQSMTRVKAADLAFDSISALYIVDSEGQRVLKIPPQDMERILKPQTKARREK